VLLKGLPYALALMTILGIHEMGHYLTARFYKKFDRCPTLSPCPFSWVRLSVYSNALASTNRKALFDLSIAGPLAGFVVTLPLLIWGLAHSTVVPLPAQPGMLNPDALNLTVLSGAAQQAGARHSVDR